MPFISCYIWNDLPSHPTLNGIPLRLLFPYFELSVFCVYSCRSQITLSSSCFELFIVSTIAVLITAWAMFDYRFKKFIACFSEIQFFLRKITCKKELFIRTENCFARKQTTPNWKKTFWCRVLRFSESWVLCWSSFWAKNAVLRIVWNIFRIRYLML